MATKAIDAGTGRRDTTGGTRKRRIRKVFGNIHEVVQMPNLIEVQRESYEQFLRSDPSIGYVSGLEKTLRSVFPIRDFAGTAELDFVNYELEPPKFDVEECRQRGITYAAPMRVTLRLIVFEVDPDTETRSVLDIKEQDVYMGDMPLMTENGTFFINGTERVIVSQMHRSPGVLFDHDRGKTHASGKFLFAARVIPYRGSWLDFEFDAKDIVNVRIDRKRKLPVTALLYALGLNSEEILNQFYNRVTFVRGQGGWQIPFAAENWRGVKPSFDIVDAKSGEVIFAAGTKITPRAANKAAKDGLETLLIPTEEIYGRYSAYDLINEQTGEIYVEAGDEIGPDSMEKLDKAGLDRVELLDIDHVTTGPWIRNTLKADKAEEREQALSDIYRVMRPGEPTTPEPVLNFHSSLPVLASNAFSTDALSASVRVPALTAVSRRVTFRRPQVLYGVMAVALADYLCRNGIGEAVAWRAAEAVICDAPLVLAGRIDRAREMVDTYLGYDGTTAAGAASATSAILPCGGAPMRQATTAPELESMNYLVEGVIGSTS